MEVRVVSCADEKLWYANKIGQTFEVEMLYCKYHLLNNQLFSIRPIDAVITSKKDSMIREIAGNVYDILKDNEFNAGKIHEVYCDRFTPTSLKNIIYGISFLSRLGKVEKTGEFIKYNTTKKSNIWRIKKQTSIDHHSVK